MTSEGAASFLRTVAWRVNVVIVYYRALLIKGIDELERFVSEYTLWPLFTAYLD